MKPGSRRGGGRFALAGLTLVLAGLIAGPGCREKETGKVRPEVETDQTRASGGPVLTMEKAAQEEAGLKVIVLKLTSRRRESSVYGTILAPGPLIQGREAWASAGASVDKAEAALQASAREYERLKRLNEDNRNVSDKEFEAAAAGLGSARADLSAARGRLEAAQDAVKAQWGPAVSQWVFSASAEFQRLVELKEVIIRITFPPDFSPPAAPPTMDIPAPGSKPVPARLVSRAPNIDPQTQGASFWYLASPLAGGLVPGLNVQSSVPVGASLEGVIVPSSAVVWSQGQAWAYVQTGPEAFARRVVPTDDPVQGGYFVPEGFRAGERVVAIGAQALLSKELFPTQPAAKEDED